MPINYNYCKYKNKYANKINDTLFDRRLKILLETYC